MNTQPNRARWAAIVKDEKAALEARRLAVAKVSTSR